MTTRDASAAPVDDSPDHLYSAEFAGTAVVTLREAEQLAGAALAAIDQAYDGQPNEIGRADRERVKSDLAGLRRHTPALCEWLCPAPGECPDRRAFTDGLRRTAALYGVTMSAGGRLSVEQDAQSETAS